MARIKLVKKLMLGAAAAGTLAVPLSFGLLTQRTAYAQEEQREEWLPIVRVAPVYPPRAALRGIEGYVIVEYTVTAQGSVQDAFVVESSTTLFEQAALDAALKFKYQPRIENGSPVAVGGVRSVLRFELEREL